MLLPIATSILASSTRISRLGVGVLETLPDRVIVGVIEKRADDLAIAVVMIDVTVINPISVILDLAGCIN